MRFSIVIPVYNVERYLSFCLDSVVAQEFRDFEVILVNDGSTDSSLSLCEKFKDESGIPVILVSQANMGLLSARRAGFAASSGDYIVSLDSDDALRSDALVRIDEAITSSGVDVVFYGFSRNDDFSDPRFPPLSPGHVYGSEELRGLFCATNRMNAMWLKAVARTCARPEARFRELGRLNMGEDAVQSALVFDHARSAIIVHEPLYFYRGNDASISACVGRSYLDDMGRVQDYLRIYAAKWDAEAGSTYVRLLLPRCAEEVCHFALHYCVGRNFAESREGLEAAASLPCIATCAVDSSSLSACPLHTRLIAKFLAAGLLRVVWFISRLRITAVSLGKGR